ncbi:carboxypeptidase-like regulatory domain-containing protein [Flavobacterium sp. J27]|nr:carboxypeptidase-like regulatory domain-containing protein [Flavobacterium sp. J27]
MRSGQTFLMLYPKKEDILTDSLGNFTIESLATGNYYLLATE